MHYAVLCIWDYRWDNMDDLIIRSCDYDYDDEREEYVDVDWSIVDSSKWIIDYWTCWPWWRLQNPLVLKPWLDRHDTMNRINEDADWIVIKWENNKAFQAVKRCINWKKSMHPDVIVTDSWEWIEKDWTGNHKEDAEEREETFNKIIWWLPDDTLITIVDTHL